MTYLSSTLSIQNNVKAFIAYYCTVNIIPGTDKDLGIINGAHLASATVPWHWLFFCPAPKFGAYFGCLVTKNLKAPSGTG